MFVRIALTLLLATTSALAAGPTRVLDLDGRAVNPLIPAPGTVATVLVFATTDCPIANRYAPEIQRLASRFGARVRFVLVYPVAADTAAVVRDHLEKFSYSIDAVRDTAQELVKHTGVLVTPEVAVLDGGARVRYRGRIDDRYIEFGKDRPEPSERDLERALEAVTAGRPVAVRETRAVGCFLADLVK
ncbi:MAG: hypothetical protein A3J29_00910 [Acidobacteria bacterium RIFCSPLOWO2_12_FULL_67_14b]|nr:MAG: hypothetical protein A3J29_00910 [Acidobacteria bacterium RIFCSPLOWO2_12_FULL_67_14b]